MIAASKPMFALFLVLCIVATGCNSKKTSYSSSDVSKGANFMVELADLIERVKFDEVGTVSLTNSDGSVVWAVKDVDQHSWNRFSKVVGGYFRKLDANQLGAVQPTHKLIIRISFIELHVDLFTVLDRQGNSDDGLIEELGKIFLQTK